jgi:hypothetical protein
MEIKTTKKITPTGFLKSWLSINLLQINAPSGVQCSLIDIDDHIDVRDQMRLLMTYMCRHPRIIIDEIERNGLQGFQKSFAMYTK